MPAPEKTKSLESWIWDAACSIRGILPLVWSIGEIIAKLAAIEAEARETEKDLRKILKQLGVSIRDLRSRAA